MQAEMFDIALCMALCFAAWGFFFLCMHRRGIDYTSQYLVTTGYFLAVAIITSLLFRDKVIPVFSDFSAPSLIALTVWMLLIACLSIVLPRALPQPAEYFRRYPDRYFLKIDPRRVISKSADIFAQQIFIIVLVVLLHDLGYASVTLFAAFCALFFLLHVPLIASEWLAWPSGLFAGVVILFSIVFPPMILFVPSGFVYNIILHWLFYVVTAGVFWIQYGYTHGRLPHLRATVARWAARSAAACLVAILLALIGGLYGIALALLIYVVFCIEIRVRLGYRTPRGPLFFVHVISGAALLFALGAAVYSPVYEMFATYFVLFSAMSFTGLILLRRGVAAHGD